MIFRLLIAEDELWLRKRLVSTIDWSSYGISEVYEAEDGGEALEIALKEKPDIVMTDIKMPVMTGLDATVIIRKENQNIPIIMQTAYAFSTDKENAMKCGATEVLVKPITLSILRNCLTNYFPQLKW